MKYLNKIIVVFAVCWLQVLSCAYGQLRFLGHSNNYLQVTSYLGKDGGERFNTFQFDLLSKGIDIKKWSLSVRLDGAITIVDGGPSKSGEVFPLDKLTFRWTTDNNNAQMNLQSFGMNLNEVFLQKNAEIMLVDQAKAPFSSYNRDYTQVFLYSSIKVTQGKYLERYQSGVNQWTHIKYRIPMLYTLYDENRKIIGTAPLVYDLHIYPNLTDGNLVDVTPDYGLEIGTEASNATLRFQSARDYLDGVSLLLENAVKVNAKSNFELQVKSVDSELKSATSGSLPLNVLSTKLTAGTGAKTILANPVLTLSTNPQMLLSGTSTNKENIQYFNLNYKAKLSQSQIVSVKPGDYAVSLVYSLIPK